MVTTTMHYQRSINLERREGEREERAETVIDSRGSQAFKLNCADAV